MKQKQNPEMQEEAVNGEMVPAPTPATGIPNETKQLEPHGKQIQPGDIIPGKTMEESQAIYDAELARKMTNK